VYLLAWRVPRSAQCGVVWQLDRLVALPGSGANFVMVTQGEG
jgi:hypothetical protein